MTPLNALRAELLDTIRVNRERLLSQEHFLEQLKISSEGLLSQEQLLELVFAYRESLVRQEQLLQELLPPSLHTLWRPPDHDAVVSGKLPALKLRKVEQATSAPDILVRIKSTWGGRLYVNHLKRITIVRGLTIRLWRTLYPIYTNTFSVYLGSRASKRWRPLVKLGDNVKTSHLSTTKVFDAIRLDTTAPKVHPVEDQAFLVPPDDHYVFPPVYVAELGEALIYGGTNLVFTQDRVICHDLYDFERDYTSEELHGRHVIDAKKMRMHLLRTDAVPDKIPVAATFVDACAPNYAHWLTEVLPRIAAFCKVERFANVPIIVNDGLHRNIMESLARIVGPDRECITLPVGRAIQIDRLCVTSVAGYVPFEPRKGSGQRQRRGEFSPYALNALRDRMMDLCQNDDAIWPQRIYLRRNSQGRQLTNAQKLLDLLVSRDFVVVDPEKLTFIQQAQLFMNAKVVVGATGAAIANAVFCPRGSQVGILLAKNEGLAYEYWVNMLTPMGINVTYILGKGSESNLHSDFAIDQAHLIDFLDALNEDKL